MNSENEDFVILEGSRRTNEAPRATFDYFFGLRSIGNLWDVWQYLAKEAINLRGKLMSLTNY